MVREKLRIALIQMDCVLKEKEANLEKSAGYINSLDSQVNVVCFPEFFTTGYSLELINDAFFELAETIPGPTTDLLGRKAKEKNLAIIGTIVEKDSSKTGVLYDTTFFIDPDGNLVGIYRKTHLYPLEHRYFRSGNDLPVIDLGGYKVSAAICYDHAFPQIFSILALKGAEVVFIPSVVPVGFEHLLDLRTRARAQDNQIFTAAVNRVGQEGESVYCGHSQVINPRGEVIAIASGDKEEILVTDIDPDLILKERMQEPVLRSMRTDIYRQLCED